MIYKISVQTFSGNREFWIDYIWFYNGRIERTRCHDDLGKMYKFKHDEEPITLLVGETE